MTQGNALSGESNRLHSGSADLVDRSSLGAVRTASSQNNLPSGSLSDIALQHVAKVGLLDLLWLDVSPFECSLEGGDTKLRCCDLLEDSVEGSNWSPGGGQNVDVLS